MIKKDLAFYAVILILLSLFLWQWLSKGVLLSQLVEFQKDNKDLHLLSGIGSLRSTHKHADVKVHINGHAADFSQHKYQLASRFIHFEEGLGDVVHIHAIGLTIGHLFKSLGGDINNNCITFESQSYCREQNKTLRFYVNNKPNNEFDNYAIKDMDKVLISYGNEEEAEIKKQLDSVTNLAPKYSSVK